MAVHFLIIVLVVVSPLKAMSSSCLNRFTSISNSESLSRDNIVEIYHSIIEQLGTNAPPFTWEKMIQSKSPFQLPHSLDSESLQSTLTEFEKMVRNTPHDFESVKGMLLQRLSNRSAKMDTVEEKLTDELILTAPVLVPWTHFDHLELKVAKKNNRLFGLDRSGKMRSSLNGHEASRAVRIHFPPPQARAHKLNQSSPIHAFDMSPDGETLYLSYQNHPHLYRASLTDTTGQPAKSLSPSSLREFDSPIKAIKTSSSGEHLLVVFEGPEGRIKILNPLETSQKDKEIQLENIQFVDFSPSGKNVIAVTSTHVHKYTLNLTPHTPPVPIKVDTKVDMDTTTPYLFQPFINNTSISPTGKELIAFDTTSYKNAWPLSLNLLDGTLKYSVPNIKLPVSDQLQNIEYTQMTPDKRYLFALYTYDTETNTTWNTVHRLSSYLLIYDFETKQRFLQDLNRTDISGLVYNPVNETFYLSYWRTEKVEGIPLHRMMSESKQP